MIKISKKKLGRPFQNGNERKVNLGIRVSREFKEDLFKRAEKEKVSASVFIEDKCQAYL